jgi:hypothetical protein
MNLDNIFYFKNIVDAKYPTGKEKPVDISSVVEEVNSDINKFSDEEFIEIMISCFIPDLYSGMGKREKLFTKLAEFMVAEWWRRLGGTYNLPTKKSGTEDIELIFNNKSIVCDAKVFRLGRSQKAPNVKDFLKLASVRLWIDNLNNEYKNSNPSHKVIGGMVTYSSLHEWAKDSEVYEECTNHETPVIMLPYEILAIILKYKSKLNSIDDFMNMWNYSENKVVTSSNKKNYWNYVGKYLCNILSLSAEDFNNEIQKYYIKIEEAVIEYKKIVQAEIDEVRAIIKKDLDEFDDIEELKKHVIHEIEKRDNKDALNYLERINKFRYY